MRSRSTPEALLRSIGVRLRQARLARRLSQEELADRTGTAAAALSRIEGGGGCSLGMLADLAAALEIPVRDLFEDAPLEADALRLQRAMAALPTDVRVLFIELVERYGSTMARPADSSAGPRRSGVGPARPGLAPAWAGPGDDVAFHRAVEMKPFVTAWLKAEGKDPRDRNWRDAVTATVVGAPVELTTYGEMRRYLAAEEGHAHLHRYWEGYVEARGPGPISKGEGVPARVVRPPDETR